LLLVFTASDFLEKMMRMFTLIAQWNWFYFGTRELILFRDKTFITKLLKNMFF